MAEPVTNASPAPAARSVQAMGGVNDLEWREALYRQLARTSGLPAGLRPELIKRAEACVDRRLPRTQPGLLIPRGAVEGCKGAIGQQR